MRWPCSSTASLCAAYLQSVQEAGEAQVLAPDLQRKCNALRAIQEKVQAAKQHKELKVTHLMPAFKAVLVTARLRTVAVAPSTSSMVCCTVPAVEALHFGFCSAQDGLDDTRVSTSEQIHSAQPSLCQGSPVWWTLVAMSCHKTGGLCAADCAHHCA